MGFITLVPLLPRDNNVFSFIQFAPGDAYFFLLEAEASFFQGKAGLVAARIASGESKPQRKAIQTQVGPFFFGRRAAKRIAGMENIQRGGTNLLCPSQIF